MKKFPHNWPELAFMVLVMALPLLIAFLWRSETFWESLGKVGVGMAIGFGVWFGLIYVICRQEDRKKRDENTQA
jgi:hypothetical protein